MTHFLNSLYMFGLIKHFKQFGQFMNNVSDRGLIGGYMDTIGLGDAYNSLTGAGLTTAQIQQNAFNASEADKARQFSASEARAADQRSYDYSRAMRQTALQDTVADANAAGINPLFAITGGATGASSVGGSTPSAPAASGSAPSASGGFDQILNVLFAKQRFEVNKAQIRAFNAQADDLLASADEKRSNKEGRDLENKLFRDTYDDLVEARRKANNLTDAQIRDIDATINKARYECEKLAEETKSEESKRIYNLSASVLARANAKNVELMRPYQIALTKAQGDLAINQARLAAVSAAYQQGLIDNGMIQKMIEETGSKITLNEAEAHYKAFSEAFESGNMARVVELTNAKGFEKIDIYGSKVLEKLLSIHGAFFNASNYFQ